MGPRPGHPQAPRGRDGGQDHPEPVRAIAWAWRRQQQHGGGSPPPFCCHGRRPPTVYLRWEVHTAEDAPRHNSPWGRMDGSELRTDRCGEKSQGNVGGVPLWAHTCLSQGTPAHAGQWLLITGSCAGSHTRWALRTLPTQAFQAGPSHTGFSPSRRGLWDP